jgi:hypothetical protein
VLVFLLVLDCLSNHATYSCKPCGSNNACADTSQDLMHHYASIANLPAIFSVSVMSVRHAPRVREEVSLRALRALVVENAIMPERHVTIFVRHEFAAHWICSARSIWPTAGCNSKVPVPPTAMRTGPTAVSTTCEIIIYGPSAAIVVVLYVRIVVLITSIAQNIVNI